VRRGEGGGDMGLKKGWRGRVNISNGMRVCIEGGERV